MNDVPVEALTKAEAEVELVRLAALIAAANRAYHTLDAPEIPDAEFDALKRRNAAIEARFPGLNRARRARPQPLQRPGWAAELACGWRGVPAARACRTGAFAPGAFATDAFAPGAALLDFTVFADLALCATGRLGRLAVLLIEFSGRAGLSATALRGGAVRTSSTMVWPGLKRACGPTSFHCATCAGLTR